VALNLLLGPVDFFEFCRFAELWKIAIGWTRVCSSTQVFPGDEHFEGVQRLVNTFQRYETAIALRFSRTLNEVGGESNA